MASNALINSNFYQIVTANATTGIPVDVGVTGNVTAGGNANVTGNLNALGNSILGSNANVYITGGTVGQVLATTGVGGALEWATVAVSNIANGTSNVDIPAINGNVNTSVGGVANVFVVTTTGANLEGTSNVTGTSSAGNFVTAGYVTATGNVTGGNILTGGVVDATGNVSGSNINTGGNVVAGGDVQANNSVITDLVTGRTGALTLASAGTDQNLILSPSGTGNVRLDPQTNITNLILTPTNPDDAASKYYVDQISAGLRPKAAVKAATIADLGGTYNNGAAGLGATLTLGAALTTLDTYTLLDGDRILVKDQANTFENGIYTWDALDPTVLTRATDFDLAAEMLGGTFVFCADGSVNKNLGWVQTSNDVGTVGSDPVLFTQQSASISYTAGTGLSLALTTFSITDTGVVAGTYGNAITVPQIVLNAQGQVTSAVNVAISLSQIANVDSNVTIPFASGDVVTNVNTVEKLRVSSTGANVTGDLNTTANANVGANLNVTGNINSLGNAILGSNANVFISGGTAGQVLSTNGVGGTLEWKTLSSNTIIDGTSDVTIDGPGGSIFANVAGNEIFRIRPDGIITTGNLFVSETTYFFGNVATGIVANAEIISTNTTTGTIKLSGAGGIALESGNIHVGGNANVAGNLHSLANAIFSNVGNMYVPDGTAGQLLSATGTGNLQWSTISSSAALPLNEFTYAGANTNDGIATTFTLSGAAIYMQAPVYVNGVLLFSSEYNITGTTLTVTRALTTGDIISVGPVGSGVTSTTVSGLSADIANVAISGGAAGDYLTATAGGGLEWTTPLVPSAIQEFTAAAGTNQTFTLSSTVITGTNASVYVNGVLQRSTQYSIAGTTLTMIRSLTAGDLVTVGATTGAVGGYMSNTLSATNTGSVFIGGGTTKRVLSSTGGSGTTWALPAALNAAAVSDVVIAGGTAGQVLTATGVGGATSWATPSLTAWSTSNTILTATTTNPTKQSTPVRDQLRWRKIGDKIYHVQIAYQQTSAGIGGSGNYLYGLPAGLQFDLTRQSASTNGNAQGMVAATYACAIPGGTGFLWSQNSTAVLQPIVYDATRFYLNTIGGSGGASYGQIHGAGYFSYATDIFVTVDFILTATA